MGSGIPASPTPEARTVRVAERVRRRNPLVMTTLAAPPTTHLWPRLRAAVGVALPSWLVARALVGVALVVARVVTNRGVDDPLARTTAAHGLLAWDGAFYADIAQHGYAALPRAALRFFPLTPLAGRAVGELGVGARVGVVIVANVAALIAGALLVVLVRREGLGDRTAARAAWLLALAPSAFVLVMGYAEALFLLAAIGAFVGLRERRWLLVVLLGVLAGLSRPGGFVLAVPIAIEAARGLRCQWRAGAVGPRRGRSLTVRRVRDVPRVGRPPVRRRVAAVPNPDPPQPEGLVRGSPDEHRERARRSRARPHDRDRAARPVDGRRGGAGRPRLPAAAVELRVVRRRDRRERGDLAQPGLVRALRARRVPRRDRRRVVGTPAAVGSARSSARPHSR